MIEIDNANTVSISLAYKASAEKVDQVDSRDLLWHDEKVDEAQQGSEDQRQHHAAGEVLVMDEVILKRKTERPIRSVSLFIYSHEHSGEY